MTGMEWKPIVEGSHTAVELGKMLKDRLEEAKKLNLENVDRCKKDLRIASDAIFALENKYTAILNEARWSDRKNSDEVKALLLSIDNYLTQEHIRPALRGALNDLGLCKTKLEKQKQKFLQWPWKKKKKGQAVDEFVKLLGELEVYYNELAAKGLALEDDPSAFNWSVVVQLRKYFESKKDSRAPAEVVDQLKSSPRAKKGYAFLAKSYDLIKTLESAFN